jgi:hypothetical protein
MKSSRNPALRDSPIKTVDLESGKPSIRDALSGLDRELAVAKQQRCTIVKLIHGYGSSGVGGDIRIAVQKRLHELQQEDQIRACIFGEDWSRSDSRTWELLKARPELKRDADLGRANRGITIVLL